MITPMAFLRASSPLGLSLDFCLASFMGRPLAAVPSLSVPATVIDPRVNEFFGIYFVAPIRSHKTIWTRWQLSHLYNYVLSDLFVEM